MLNVTDEARLELRALLLDARSNRSPSAPVELALRLLAGDGEQGVVGLTFDVPRDDDRVIEFEGQSLLFIDPETLRLVDDLTLDVVKTAEGSQLGLISERAMN